MSERRKLDVKQVVEDGVRSVDEAAKHLNGHHTNGATAPTAPTEDNRKFAPYRMGLAELLKLPPKEWLVDKVFGQGDLVMLYGPPGSGKTFVIIDLIFSVCLKRTWALRFDVTRPLTVAYCAGEGVAGLPGRFAAAAELYGVDEDGLPGFSFFPVVPQLHEGKGQFDATAARINHFIVEWKEMQEAGEVDSLDLLIIDTLHSATVGADENSAGDMGVAIASARRAARELGCTVMTAHHTTKDGEKYRGSSAVHGALDTMILLKPIAKNLAKMQCDKLKDGGAWAAQTYKLTSKAASAVIWWSELVGDSTETPAAKEDGHRGRIVEILEQEGPLSAKDLADLMSLNNTQYIYSLVNPMAERGTLVRSRQNPAKKKSTSNPWVYSVPTAGEDDEAFQENEDGDAL